MKVINENGKITIDGEHLTTVYTDANGDHIKVIGFDDQEVLIINFLVIGKGTKYFGAKFPSNYGEVLFVGTAGGQDTFWSEEHKSILQLPSGEIK